MLKRAPLPPQSDRFREVSRTSRPPPVVPPLPTGNYRVPSYSQESDRSARSAANGSSAPSGPRGSAQLPVEQGRSEADTGTRPSSGRTRTRFDNIAPPPTAFAVATPQPERTRDTMDVDYPSRGSVPRNDDGPYRQGAITRDRAVEPSMSAVPTGPRAMSRQSSGYPPQAPPSVPPTQGFPSRPFPIVTSGPGKAGPLPPRSSRERPEHLPASSTRVGNQGPPPSRMYDNGRAGPDIEGTTDRLRSNTSQDHSNLVSFHRLARNLCLIRHQDLRTSLGSKLSGTNNIPIANKRQFGTPESSDHYARTTSEGRRDYGPQFDAVPILASSVIYQTESRRVCPINGPQIAKKLWMFSKLRSLQNHI